MPEISVIIPVYNKEKYIEKSLRSVLNQPFGDIEVIIVDDGSTDASLTIVQGIAKTDNRIVVVDIPNGGVSNARNVGLSHAKGEWIQFLDADDLLEPDYLTQAMQVLRDQPVDILFSGFTMVNEQMEPVRQVALPEEGHRNQIQLCDHFIRYQYETGFFGYISNKLFRRNLLEKSGAQFPVGTTLAEDLDFYAKLYPYVGRAYFWQGKSFFYLQTQTNYLNNPVVDYYSQIQIHLDIKAWFIHSGLFAQYQDVLDAYVCRYAYYILFYDNEDGKDVGETYRFLRQRTDIMACIDPNYMDGFARRLLRCLCRESLLGIKVLFGTRNMIRSLYRMVKKNG